MTEENKALNLYQKIVQVRQVAEGFSKDKSSYGYSYVSGNQVLSKIKDKMNELNLLLLPSTQVGEHHTHAYKTSRGKDVLDFVVKGEMTYTWINADNPEEREPVTWAYYGQQDEISKAYGSGLTYSERYYLLKSLGLPTDEDDPDAKKPQETKPEPPPTSLKSKWKVLSEGELDGFDEWVAQQMGKGWDYKAMEQALTKKIQEKKAKEEQPNE
ncbi:ERF family protein [Paenibacillus glucanolyticus]|uniref:ERF family protein n=1 Tax=Paenibacillus glucanolyticus TaxID=59843 RepID=UPI00096C2D47|nr:ERF family protein [Paenibacillus glucanolyticus]OMF70469.1 hypothetical protein BK142_23630 [Paenibacillus glucanolyticus]